MSNHNSLNTLDNMRLSEGNKGLLNYFHKLLVRDTSKAVTLINQNSLSFPSLFILSPHIRNPYFFRYLNTRNKDALTLIKALKSKNFSRFNKIKQSISNSTSDLLKWILETGKNEDLSRGEYIEILDSCALILIREYKDNSILPTLKEIIYNRYKQGMFIHDMVWAFFECRDPNCILMLANNLNSEDGKDVELTKKLLKFIPVVRNNSLPSEILYKNVSYWFKENYPFIYYTGECFQQMPNPSPFEVSLDAKYLFKKVSNNGSIESTLTQNELRLMNIFDTLGVDSKILLSSYSSMLHKQNLYLWNSWIHLPIGEQLRISSSKLGGIPC